MNALHLISGNPEAFVSGVNGLIAKRDVALTVGRISIAGGCLVAAVEELPRGVNTRGAMIEMRIFVGSVRKGQKFVDALAVENPCWVVEAVLPFPGESGNARDARAKKPSKVAKEAEGVEVAGESGDAGEDMADPAAGVDVLVVAVLCQP